MKNGKSLIALILMIVLAMPMIMQIPQRVNAASTVNVTDYLFVSVAPSPVGVGQTVYVSIFFTKPIPTMYGGAAQYTGLTINIVKPDGTNETLGPYTADTTGGVGGITFAPAAIGNYTFQGVFPGQSLGADYTGTTYNMNPALSPPVKLVVQQSPVSGYSSPPLPTSYWTRPIYGSNYGWAQTVGGNWYGLGRPAFDNTGGYDASGNNFQPYSTAPTTSHILWTKPTTTGGQPGGETVANQMSSYASTSPLYHSCEMIILNGVVYYNLWAAQTDNAGITAVNLRTGQTLWTQNTTDTLIYGQVVNFHNNEEFGSQAFLWTSHLAGYDGMGMFGPNAIYDYNILDPVTGNQMATVTDVSSAIAGLFATSTSALIDSNESNTAGAILIYYVDSSNNLVMWNSTQCLSPAGGFGSPTGSYKPTGSYNFTAGIMWTVPLPTANPAFGLFGGVENNQAIVLTSYPSVLPTFAVQYGGSYATDVAYDPITGAKLWGPINQTLPEFDQVGVVAAGDGVYVRHDKDTDQLYGYSVTTGQLLWGPTQLVGNALSHLYESAAIAYGKVYIWDFGGYCNAVDLSTGKLVWNYTRGSSGYDNPYGSYPLWVYDSQSIADGMLFLSEGRLYDPPLFPNGEKLALNCTDGTVVWEINGAFQRDVAPIADGEMLAWNGYDGQTYAFGTGPTQIAVTAPDPVTTVGSPMVIRGTVTDISAGASQEAVAANFPNGLPCVSDSSMTPFMEAVYEQQSMPTNVTGVPVSLYVLDSNHNYRQIGSTTSDASGMFTYTWTPDIPGDFTVYAVFAGSQSYYGSSAETSFYASAAAPTVAPTATPQANLATTSDLMTYMAVGVIAIIIAIAIVGILMLRKHP
jgi:outer membrane protein assembly factor BamB